MNVSDCNDDDDDNYNYLALTTIFELVWTANIFMRCYTLKQIRLNWGLNWIQELFVKIWHIHPKELECFECTTTRKNGSIVALQLLHWF